MTPFPVSIIPHFPCFSLLLPFHNNLTSYCVLHVKLEVVTFNVKSRTAFNHFCCCYFLLYCITFSGRHSIAYPLHYSHPILLSLCFSQHKTCTALPNRKKRENSTDSLQFHCTLSVHPHFHYLPNNVSPSISLS